MPRRPRPLDPNKNGFLIRGGSADNILSDFLPHLLVHGGWVVDENNQPTVDYPRVQGCHAGLPGPVRTWAAPWIRTTSWPPHLTARPPLAQIWPGWYIPTADGPANYTVIPTKLNDSDTPKNTSLYGVWCIGIPNNAPHKDLALELLEYVMSPEVQLASIEVGGVPCRTSCLLNEDVLATYPQYETVCAALQTGVYRPVIAEWTRVHQHSGYGDGQHHSGYQDHRPGSGYAQTQLVELMNG